MSNNFENDLENNLDKIKNNNVSNDIDKELQKAYKNAEQLSLIPLLKLIYLSTNINLYEEFKLSIDNSHILKSGEIIMTNENKKIKVYLGIVEKEYDLDYSLNKCKILSDKIDKLKNETNTNLQKQIINIITLLTHSISIVFNQFKNKYKELTEYNISLDTNTTVYLDYDLDKRIGVIFEEIIE